jgi:mRNA interferase RelE/StbE
MTYKILYHKAVLKKDLKSLSKKDRLKINVTITSKLSEAPEQFGEALRKELKGYYRLRVGNYRVVYRVNKGAVEVLIIKIGLRKDFLAYIESAKRLNLL